MAARKRVLLVGLTTLDIINICEWFPKEDEDSRASKQYWQKGGNAANSAEVLAQFGDVEVFLMSSFANNHEGRFTQEHLMEKGVNLSNCKFHDVVGFPTSCCILSQSTGSRTIVHCRNGMPELTVKDFESNVELSNYDWIHFEGRGFPDVTKMVELSAKFRDRYRTLRISVELEKPKHFDSMTNTFLRSADVVFVSKDMASYMNYSSARETVQRIKKDYSLAERMVIICPWEDKGADAIDSEGNLLHQDAFIPSQLVDTLGAGDTFIAGVLYSLLQGKSLQNALLIGCKLAGEKCGQIGYDGISVKEY